MKSDQGHLFYEFRLGDAVPEDHIAIDAPTAIREIPRSIGATRHRPMIPPGRTVSACE